MIRKNKWILSFCVGNLLMLLFCGSARSQDDRIIAIVNDELITLSELKNYITTTYMAMSQRGASREQLEKLKTELETKALDRLIEERLMLSEANERGMKVNARVVDEQIKTVKERYPSEQDFIDALAQSGTTLGDLKKKFSDKIKIKSFVDSQLRARVAVNPNEVIRYYKQHLKDYWQKGGIDLNSIFIGFGKDKNAAKDRLDKVTAALQSGKDFMDVAKEYSDSPSIGVVQKGELVLQIEDAVFKLKEGQISPVIETDTGYYFFQMKKSVPMEVIPFHDVKDKIKNDLYQQKFKDDYKNFLNDLKKKAYVEIKQ